MTKNVVSDPALRMASPSRCRSAGPRSPDRQERRPARPALRGRWWQPPPSTQLIRPPSSGAFTGFSHDLGVLLVGSIDHVRGCSTRQAAARAALRRRNMTVPPTSPAAARGSRWPAEPQGSVTGVRAELTRVVLGHLEGLRPHMGSTGLGLVLSDVQDAGVAAPPQTVGLEAVSRQGRARAERRRRSRRWSIDPSLLVTRCSGTE